MMKTINNIEELKVAALKIDGTIRVYYPKFSMEEELKLKYISTMEKTYKVNNNVLNFACDGSFYVIPCTQSAMEILKKNGYKRKDLYVPFSNGDYPIDEKSKWLLMCETIKD